MSEFYTSIADYYDFVFPLNKTQLNFILGETNVPYENKHLLDIGCGTGNLSIALADSGINITGIDYDMEMVNKAKIKCRKLANISIMFHDMRKLTDIFQPRTFNNIVCFGNTIVHLTDPADIYSFFKQSAYLLTSDGKLLIQIINYDRILDKKIKSLSTIENENIRFERNYNYNKTSGLIEFSTILLIKGINKKIKNIVQLYPFRKEKITELLLKSGYKNIEYYGDFRKTSLSSESVPLIFSAKK